MDDLTSFRMLAEAPDPAPPFTRPGPAVPGYTARLADELDAVPGRVYCALDGTRFDGPRCPTCGIPNRYDGRYVP